MGLDLVFPAMGYLIWRGIAEADKPSSVWYRTVTYNMILIACNTGMRPAEMKNLRWRDIMPAKKPRGPRNHCLVRAGQGQVPQAGRS
jgi:integrase